MTRLAELGSSGGWLGSAVYQKLVAANFGKLEGEGIIGPGAAGGSLAAVVDACVEADEDGAEAEVVEDEDEVEDGVVPAAVVPVAADEAAEADDDSEIDAGGGLLLAADEAAVLDEDEPPL